MNPIIRIITYDENATKLFDSSTRRLKETFSGCRIAQENENSNTIYFASGGSEKFAIEIIQTNEIHYLLAGKDNNSWAAASEVLAWSKAHGYSIQLYSIDVKEEVEDFLNHLSRSNSKLLHGKRIGLIGESSDWLVASDINKHRMKNIFGAEVIHLPWNELPDYLSFEADDQISKVFPKLTHQQQEIASISSFLKSIIATHKLDAITIQCFKMVREKEVTACLPVALMNYNNIPAGCEGDLTSIFGMLLLQEITGQIPWMANIAAIENGKILLAHCTAPLQMATSFEILSHFETKLSCAVSAEMDVQKVTIFRLDSQLKQFFVAEGMVTDKPNYDWACRTQIKVEMPVHAIKSLQTNPLGNHHLVLSGHFAKAISKIMSQSGIVSIVESMQGISQTSF